MVVPSDGVFTRRHTADCALCTVFYSVFCFSTMLPWGGGGGGRNNCFFEWCFLPLSICTGFYSVFRAFALLFFCTICVFPWFLQCFEASWRCSCYAAHWGGVGWGNHVHVNLITLLRLHHVADATLHIGVGWGGGDVNVLCNLLTLLMLRHAGVGGMLTFHVTCAWTGRPTVVVWSTNTHM